MGTRGLELFRQVSTENVMLAILIYAETVVERQLTNLPADLYLRDFQPR